MIFQKDKNGFISLSSYNHNRKIERVIYGNEKITKPLFYCGLVLPDFKISWVLLLGYLVYTYPIKFSVVLRHKLSDLYLFIIRGYLRL